MTKTLCALAGLLLSGCLFAQLPSEINKDSLAAEMAKVKQANKERAAKTSFTYLLLKAEGGTHGYCILANGQVYIWQTTLPGRAGKQGFAKKEQATACAERVIEKIKQGEIPPTLSEEELDAIINPRPVK